MKRRSEGKKRIAVGLAVMLALAGTGCASPQTGGQESAASGTEAAEESAAPEEVIRLSFANVDSEEHPVSQSIMYFADQVAELSGGSMEVEYYLSGVLGDEEAETEGVLSGELDFTRVNGGNVASWVPACGVFSIPFLFNDLDSFKAKMASEEVYAYFDQEFQDAGLKLLAFWYDGVRHMYTTDHFIETVDDLKGLKMRTMTSPLIVSAFETIGVNPTPINYSEVYTALQQGIVTAAENNMNALYDSRHYEVAPYVTGTGHLMFPAVVIMNLDRWNSLSPENQEILTQAMANTFDYEYDLVHEQEETALQKILDDGGMYQEFPQEQKEALQDMLDPFYDEVAGELGQEVLDLVIE